MVPDVDEWLGNLLAAMISLRVFTFRFVSDLSWAPLVLLGPEPAHLLFVRTVTDRAPHLKYFAVLWGVYDYHWKRVHGEWVPCHRAEFPLHRQLRKSLH
jgi:hypothetical protein